MTPAGPLLQFKQINQAQGNFTKDLNYASYAVQAKKKKKSGGSNDGTELTRGMVCSVPKLPMIVRQEG